MKKVIATMALVTASAGYGAAQLFAMVPTAVGTAVIAEKSDKAIGGQTATLLPKNLTDKQGHLLNEAYAIAKEDGHKDPEVVQAILLQETNAGGMKVYNVANPGPDAYFGPMQIKLSAAKDVLAKNPNLYDKYQLHTRTDDEIKANLILNDAFNIEVASKYLLMLKNVYGFKGMELINAYNRGPGGVKSVGPDYHYAVAAESKLSVYKHSR